MNKYEFRLRLRPIGKFRENEVVCLLKLIQKTLNIRNFFDNEDKTVELNPIFMKIRFENKLSKKNKYFKDIGVNVSFFTIPPSKRDNSTLRINIHTGTQPEVKQIDFCSISLHGKENIPDFTYLRKTIEIFRPFEGYLEEAKNESNLASFDRQRKYKDFIKPVIIRGLHYFDESLSNSIGGIDYCLKAPAWKVERFCEGVLIQLTEDIFDPEIPEHLEIQKEVMKYFSIWDW